MFSKSLCDYFDRESNFLGRLTKLLWTSTVKDYVAAFETLSIRTDGLGDDFYLECFINGLKEAIQAHVQMHHPAMWMDACKKVLKVELV